MQTVRTVVFDLDGTLLDSAPDLRAAVNAGLTGAGLRSLDLETTIGFIGNGVEVLIRRAIAHVADAPDRIDAAGVLETFRSHYAAHGTQGSRLYPGATDTLDALRARGIVMGICTNKPEGAAHRICDAFDLTHRMAVIVGGDTLPVRKPDPAPLLHTIDRIGGRPGSTLYVGDSGVDHATSKAAGVPFVFVTGGYQRAPIDDFAPEYTVDDLRDILTLAGAATAVAP